MNAERRKAFLSADWAERLAIHDQVAARKADALQARRNLGWRYLQQHPPTFVVAHDRGLVSLGLLDETAPARAEAMALTAGRAAQADNRALEFPVLGKDFPASGPAMRLAQSPLILAPLVQYFGMLPVLFNAFVTRAHNTELLLDSAHRFHLDPEDVISLKVFVHLTDVDEDSGPLHVLRADATQTMLNAVDYRAVARIDDAQVAERVGWAAVTRFCGPAGTVVVADTCRCLHFGGRPRAARQPVRLMLVFQYLLPTSFLFPVDGDCQHPRHLPNLEPAGDALWDALIGSELT